MYVCIHVCIIIMCLYVFLPIFVRFMVTLVLLLLKPPNVTSNTSPIATAKFSVFLNKSSASGNCNY